MPISGDTMTGVLTVTFTDLTTGDTYPVDEQQFTAYRDSLILPAS